MLNFKIGHLVPVIVITLLAGCGQSEKGPERRAVEGTVSYDKTPIEFGEIRFLPTNEGPVTIATIQDGKYQLPAPHGVPIGTALIKISALAPSEGGLPEPGKSSKPKQLEIPKKYNTESQMTAEIPSGAGMLTLNFDLDK